MEKYAFFIWYTAFVIFIVQISAMVGTVIITDGTITPPIPPPEFASGVSGVLFTVVSDVVFLTANIWYFVQLMSINSNFFLLGTVIFTPLAIGILWVIIEALNPLG